MLKEKCSFCRKLEVDDGRDRCIFHCEKDSWITKHDPSNDKFDLGTEVNYFWDEKKVKKFWKKFKKLIEKEKEDLSEEESYYRFYGFIFPKMEQDTFKDYTFNCDLVFTKDCIFEGDINFFQTIFNRQIYFNDCKIKGKVSFGKSIFKDRFTFNNMKEIKEVFFKHAQFKEKVEFKESCCEKVDFENATFEKLADFYRTKFYKVNFERADFKEIAVFSETEFYCDVNFKYTKFFGKSIFRDVVITGELNLRDSSFNDEANFLDITSKKRKKSYKDEYIGDSKEIRVSNRETARIIKNFYDSTNNIIEANKFYALEMKKREYELKESIKEGHFKFILESIIFKIHGLASNHSQDWLLSLLWIINITFLYTIFSSANNYHNNMLATTCFYSILFILFIYENPRFLIKIILIFYLLFFSLLSTLNLDIIADKINPFSIMTSKEPISFELLIYKIIIAYLIYQFIVSIRQNTRRK